VDVAEIFPFPRVVPTSSFYHHDVKFPAATTHPVYRAAGLVSALFAVMRNLEYLMIDREGMDFSSLGKMQK